MQRIVYIIRHSQAEGTRYNRMLFGKEGGALTEEGIQEAKTLKLQLKALGIDVNTEHVAVSDLQRTYQTASYAGFMNITVNSLLNEVNTGLPPEELEILLENKHAPEAAIKAAKAILDNPPAERVWVTHGLVVAGIAHELGIAPGELFVPEMGSVSKVTIP
jgi:phosphohistidine phosphatase SixA